MPRNFEDLQRCEYPVVASQPRASSIDGLAARVGFWALRGRPSQQRGEGHVDCPLPPTCLAFDSFLI